LDKTTEEKNNKNLLVRTVGFVGIALLALNSIIGAGIFTLPAIVATNAGTASPWLFLFVGLGIITVVLTFGQLASYFKDSGGPILYTKAAFGPLTGFSTGWILYISRVTAFGANSNALVLYLSTILPWANTGQGRAAVITITCLGLTWVNYIGVKDGIRTLSVFTILKLTPILLLILIGLKHVSSDVFLQPNLPNINELGETILLLVYAFVGFESATYVSGESTDPKKSLPDAMIKTVLFVGIIYFLIALVFISVLPSGGSDITLVSLGEALLGPVGIIIIALAAVFSIGGNLGSLMLAVPRLTFSLSEQNLLPKWFGNIHTKYQTPANSILFFGILSLVFALSGSFVFLVIASSLTRLLSYIASICALPIIIKSADEKAKAESLSLVGGYTIPIIAFLVCVWIAAQSNIDAWKLTLSLLGIGLILFAFARKTIKKSLI